LALKTITPFEFRQCTSLLKSTGRKAGNLKELRNILAVTSTEAIFHHTYQYFLKGHRMEYTNDFAHWAGESLEERALSEQLANIDPYAFAGIEELRDELIRVMDEYQEKFPDPRAAMPGDEFHFNETVTLVFPVGVRAKNLAEFLMALKYIDTGCIYFHFYEARIRLGGGTDDFSKWFGDALGKKELTEKVRAIDPFMHDIDGIRDLIAAAVEEEVKIDMEVVHI
jgi:hypothetical protein